MNTINYQPTGVYSQFVQNPGLLAKRNVQPQEQTPVIPEKKTNKALKAILKLGIVAAAIGIGYCSYKFKNYYDAGVKKMLEKAERLPEINSNSELQKHMKEKCYSAAERKYLEQLLQDSEKYSNNIVGKLHRGLEAYRNFFKNNFYNY